MVSFIIWITFILSIQKKKLESLKKVCENKDFCNVTVPSEDTKILEFNQYRKSDKAQFIVHADLERIIEKIGGCKNNPENSSTQNKRTFSIRFFNVYNIVI